MVTGLLGPNGAGKTTTIRAMTGLVTPEGGRVEVDGIDVAARPIEARARLGVVPETIGVYDHLTVREHVEYSARTSRHVAGRDRVEHRQRCWRISISRRWPAVAPPGCRWANDGAWRWRARWCIDRPTCVFDEPTNGLDVLGARTVRNDIRRLAELGPRRPGLQPRHAGGRRALRSRHRHGPRRHLARRQARGNAAADRMRHARRRVRSHHRIRRGVELMRAWRVARKELREGLRDRRSLMSGLFYGIWGPAGDGSGARRHGAASMPTSAR